MILEILSFNFFIGTECFDNQIIDSLGTCFLICEEGYYFYESTC